MRQLTADERKRCEKAAEQVTMLDAMAREARLKQTHLWAKLMADEVGSSDIARASNLSETAVRLRLQRAAPA